MACDTPTIVASHTLGAGASTIGDMTTPRGVKPRGTAKEPVPIGYKVERSAKERFDAIAARAGVSKAIMFESMVEHVQLREDGLPAWWTDEETLVS